LLVLPSPAVIDDRDFSWMGKPAPKPAVIREHALWSLTKRGHRVDARARVTSFAPEILILLDGELWWSHAYRGVTEAALTAAAEAKRAEFEAKGWTVIEAG
jgi:hypothetical protein